MVVNRTLALILMLIGTQIGAAPQDFAFTYQGELRYQQQAVNDQCDLIFSLYDAASGGAQVGVPQTLNAVTIAEGLFTAPLDFGDVYDGTQLYLEIQIGAGCGDAGAAAETLPRTTLTSAPFSSYAMTSALTEAVDWSSIANRPPGLDDGDDDTPPTSYAAGTGLTLSGNNFSLIGSYRLPQGCGNGQIAAWNNGAWTCGNDQNSTQFWALGGSSGTIPGTHFLGTTDNQALELKVNGDRALRIEPTSLAPNLIGGYSSNEIQAGIQGATIGGGIDNLVGGDFATVGGGAGNKAFFPATSTTVGGGFGNMAYGAYAVIGGGDSNIVLGDAATVAGGRVNSAFVQATVSGGHSNYAEGSYSAIGGGQNNSARAEYSAVLGGQSNVAAAKHSVVGGGEVNIAGAESDFELLEICSNNIDDNADGQTDEAGCLLFPIVNAGDYAIVNGGFANKASSLLSAVGGGGFNRAKGSFSTVGGGLENEAAGDYATVVGGNASRATGPYSTAGGINARARLRGQRAFASTGFGLNGDAQSSAYTLSNETTDAMPINLYLDGLVGSGELLTLPVDMNMTFDIQVVATISGSFDFYGYSVRGVAQNDSGTIFLRLGTPFENGGVPSLWSASVVANSASDSLDIEVTGEAGATIRWVATVRTTEVIFP